MELSDFQQTEAFTRGDATRRSVLGDEHVDRSYKSANDLTKVWRQFSTEASWGQIWGRPGLDLRTRSICTVSALIALGATRELRTHLRGAMRLGITRDELVEMIVHVSGYAGFAKGGDAFEALDEIASEAS